MMNRMIILYAKRPDILNHYLDNVSSVYGILRENVDVISLGKINIISISTSSNNSEVAICKEVNNYYIAIEGFIHLPEHKPEPESKDEDVLYLMEFIEDCFERDNIEGLSKLEGKFNVYVISKKGNKISVFRDKIGLKTLYYYESNKGCIFSSRIKLILPFLGFSPKINESVIYEYLRYRNNVGSETLFCDINRILPGRVFYYPTKQYSFYWRPISKEITRTDKQFCEQFKGNLHKSIRNNISENENFGIALSGGFDSSLLAIMAAENLGQKKTYTYTIGFEEEGYNEIPVAEEIAKLINSKHTNIVYKRQDFVNDFEKAIIANEFPLSSPSAVPTFKLYNLASGDVNILLTGECADALTGGNWANYFIKLSSLSGKLKKWILGFISIAEGLKLLKLEKHKLNKIKYALTCDNKTYLLNFLEYSGENQVCEILRPSFELNINYRQMIIEQGLTINTSNIVTWVLLNIVHPAEPNYMENIATESNISLRFPFASNKMLGFGLSLEKKHMIRRGKIKYGLKMFASSYLPKESLNLKKSGFGLPLHKWLRANSSSNSLLDILISRRTLERGYYRKDALIKLVDLAHNGKLYHLEYEGLIWCILNLEMWIRAMSKTT